VKTVLNNLWTHIGHEDDGRLVHTDKRTGMQFVSVKMWPNLVAARQAGECRVHSCSTECDSRSMMSLLAELDRSNVVDVDLGSAEFKANAHRNMAEWARRRPFYVLGNGPPQVVVGRYADVHRVFSDTETFKSEMPRGADSIQAKKMPQSAPIMQRIPAASRSCRVQRSRLMFRDRLDRARLNPHPRQLSPAKPVVHPGADQILGKRERV
jgi:hypothetical protein